MPDDDPTVPDLGVRADGDEAETDAETDELPYGFVVRSGRPRVVCNAVNLADLTDGVLVLLREHNDPPELYLGPEGLTRVRRAPDETLIMEALDAGAISLAIARVVDTVRASNDGQIIVDPPTRLVATVTSHAAPGFPSLLGIARSPLLDRDGRIVATSGYDATSRLYFELAPGLDVGDVPMHPSAADVERARLLLVTELLGEFLWIDSGASLANTVGLLITSVVRLMFDGCVPLHAVTANQQGTGKTLICQIANVVATGEPPTTNPYPSTTDELRKLVTSIVRTGPTLVVLDNVEGLVRSWELARLLTSPRWGDRLLGVNTALTLPNRATWALTGNAIRFGGDLARRVVPVGLIADRPDPWNRTGFHHPNLIGWTTANRGRLLWSIFVIARHWIDSGRPDGSTIHGGGFESWSATVGGILDVAGIAGHLTNLHTVTEADWEAESWSLLLDHLIAHGYSSGTFTTAELVERSVADAPMREALVEVVPGELSAKSLGESFARRAGRWHVLDDGDMAAVRAAGMAHRGRRQWEIAVRSLPQVSTNGPSGLSATDDGGSGGTEQGHSVRNRGSDASPRSETAP